MHRYKIYGVGSVMQFDAVSPEVAEAMLIEEIPQLRVEQMVTRRVR